MVDTAAAWAAFWAPFKAALGGNLPLLAIVGGACIAWGIVKFFWDKARNRGGDMKKMGYWILAGLLLASPDAILPAILSVVDFILNFVISLINGNVK